MEDIAFTSYEDALWPPRSCPCPHDDSQEDPFRRHLEEEEAPTPEVWQTVVVAVTVAIMFYFMITDKIYPDWVMVSGLMVFMVTEIITIKEGLVGFANEGVLTVMALFVVAESVSRTGALDYYMGLLMGKPKTIVGAQLRLMVPIAACSAFLNNTPIVAVMIPLTLRWAKNIGVPRQQLLMPLSYATILGGTCTLVGTSTNIVTAGLLKEDDASSEEEKNFGLFDIAIYGIPNCLIGLAYMLMASGVLLPNGGGGTNADTEDLLLGARVTPWSPAAGRTVQRSGLGASGGIFLVNVQRASTGNLHRAVSKDFVLFVGDELYFTGSVAEFGAFCELHGLEIITTENISASTRPMSVVDATTQNGMEKPSAHEVDDLERIRLVNHLSDQIDGRAPVVTGPRPTNVIVSTDVFHTEGAVMVGVDCHDRPGLLKDISQALFQLRLEVRHTEAKVFGDRSLSVWRCETMNSAPLPDQEEVWSALNDMLSSTSNDDVVTGKKMTGVRVVRAVVTKTSSLIGRKPADVKFRQTYKAAIVAYQKNGRNAAIDVEFTAGDLLVLETSADSPLLREPPKGFYEPLEGRSQRGNLKDVPQVDSADGDLEADAGTTLVWKNLKVVSDEHVDEVNTPQGEFLTAFVIPPKSPLENKSMKELGYTKLPGVVLVSIERHFGDHGSESVDVDASFDEKGVVAVSSDDALQVGDVVWFSGSAEAIADLQKVHGLVFYQEKEIEKAASSLHDRRLVQAVVARGSPLIGHTVADVHFRSTYGGAVIAIQRGSDRVHEHPANVKLQTGDVLLIEAGVSFVKKQANNYRTFALLSEVENSAPPRPRLFLVCVALIIVMLATSAVDLVSLLVTASIAGIIMVALGVVTQQEARDAVQWDLFVVVASAFGVAAAMINSGVAKGLATSLVFVGKSLKIGDAGVYGAVYLGTNVLSSVLTNNAAAILMYPIAMGAAAQTGCSRLKMAKILMLAASDYITSFGYQTNLMVYGPGGYTNMDFLRFGAPMQLILWFSSTAMVSAPDDSWYISWIICFPAFIFVAAVRLTNGASLNMFKKKSTEQAVPEGGKPWQFAASARDS